MMKERKMKSIGKLKSISTGDYKMPKYPKITSKEIPYANAPSGKATAKN